MSDSHTERSMHRSYLYASGARPEIMGKAARSPADAVILDLEDAVAPSAKKRALQEVCDFLSERDIGFRGPDLHVRVNRSAQGYDLDEVRRVARRALSALRLPKVETAESVRAVGDLLDSLGPKAEGVLLYPTIESAVGLTKVVDIAVAHPRVARFALGATDLMADLGAASSHTLLYAQNRLVLETRAAGLPAPVDCVHTDVHDVEGLAEAARNARALGFFGKSIIHPIQLEAVHNAFTPGDEEVQQARRVVQAYEEAEARGQSAIVVDGEFIDLAVAQRSRAVLRILDRAGDVDDR
ncbi:MAG TPA: CoA ester lyase [Candidatus Nocardiopsis merdipullorum]|nr:CoA ester lyase [Candidatus Nocardiopsis merdipullorum]